MDSFIPESATSIQTKFIFLDSAHTGISPCTKLRGSYLLSHAAGSYLRLHCIEHAEEVWRPRLTGSWLCLQDFLRQCFQKDPEKRPGAEALLKHPWLLINRQTLRASWSRTQDRKSRGGRTQAHASVASVVERMLEVRSLACICPCGGPSSYAGSMPYLYHEAVFHLWKLSARPDLA